MEEIISAAGALRMKAAIIPRNGVRASMALSTWGENLKDRRLKILAHFHYLPSRRSMIGR